MTEKSHCGEAKNPEAHYRPSNQDVIPHLACPERLPTSGRQVEGFGMTAYVISKEQSDREISLLTLNNSYSLSRM